MRDVQEQMRVWRRERRVLTRVSRAAWRLRSAERERDWALISARAEGVSIRALAKAVGLSPSRVHQILTAADIDGDALTAMVGDLREVGWPAPEDPDGTADSELDGRELIADRLDDEVQWIRQAAGWLTQLVHRDYPPVVSLRPDGDAWSPANIVVDTERVIAVLERIAFDIEELARARRTDDLNRAAVDEDRRTERRRRLAEPDLDFRTFCKNKRMPSSSTPQLEKAWDAWQAERYERGERADHPEYTENPYRNRPTRYY